MPEVSDDALFLKNFNIYRKDRMSRGSNTAHGGVFIAIQKSIISREIAIHTCMNDVVAAVFEHRHLGSRCDTPTKHYPHKPTIDPLMMTASENGCHY